MTCATEPLAPIVEECVRAAQGILLLVADLLALQTVAPDDAPTAVLGGHGHLGTLRRQRIIGFSVALRPAPNQAHRLAVVLVILMAPVPLPSNRAIRRRRPASCRFAADQYQTKAESSPLKRRRSASYTVRRNGTQRLTTSSNGIHRQASNSRSSTRIEDGSPLSRNRNHRCV